MRNVVIVGLASFAFFVFASSAFADVMLDNVSSIQSAAMTQLSSMLNAYGGFIGIVLGIVLFSVIARMVMGWLR
jgi:hypothetical protein